jgi:hypothetical protein
MEDVEQRNKTLDNLEHIELMTSATLALARDDFTNEPRKPFELGVLFSIYVPPPPMPDKPPLTTAPPSSPMAAARRR